MRERPFLRTVSALPVAGQSGKAGEEGRRRPQRANQDWGPQVAPFGQTTDPDKSFRGWGVQGKGRPFSKRALPCQKEFLTLFQQTHDAPEEGAAGGADAGRLPCGLRPAVFPAPGVPRLRHRAREGRQKILHVRLGSGEQLSRHCSARCRRAASACWPFLRASMASASGPASTSRMRRPMNCS